MEKVGRRLLEGDNKIWVKIDNQETEISDAVEIYKPGRAKAVSGESLFMDESEIEDVQTIETKKLKEKHMLTIGIVITTVLLVCIGIVVMINN